MKNILVTGSAGFIGSHLTKKFLLEGHKVLGIDNLNTYYDPSLKKARLKDIEKFIQVRNLSKNYTFSKTDLIFSTSSSHSGENHPLAKYTFPKLILSLHEFVI